MHFNQRGPSLTGAPPNRRFCHGSRSTPSKFNPSCHLVKMKANHSRTGHVLINFLGRAWLQFFSTGCLVQMSNILDVLRFSISNFNQRAVIWYRKNTTSSFGFRKNNSPPSKQPGEAVVGLFTELVANTVEFRAAASRHKTSTGLIGDIVYRLPAYIEDQDCPVPTGEASSQIFHPFSIRHPAMPSNRWW